MTEETIRKIHAIQASKEELRKYDKSTAEDIVEVVLDETIKKYEKDYNNYVPEEEPETIEIYAYYKRVSYGYGKKKFSMTINGNEYTTRPDETCARNFDILESVAYREGIKVVRLSKNELLEKDAMGGYKFCIRRRDLEEVINHPQVLKQNKTIPKTLSKIRKS